MNLVVDGYIFELQSHGGISRLFKEILPIMCDLDNKLTIELLIYNPAFQSLPFHPQINKDNLSKVRTFLRPRRFWSRIEYSFAFRENIQNLFFHEKRGAIWHSTYFTKPHKWDGPIVLTVHDLIYERYFDLFNSPEDDLLREQKRKCIAISDIIIADSLTTKQDLQNYYKISADKIRVIPCAHSSLFRKFDFCKGSLELITITKKPFLLFVGKRSHHKNFINLVKSYNIWNKKNEIDLVVVGEKWDSNEIEYLNNFGLSDSVHLLENISDQGLCSLYNLAFAFVHPSIYEGFGIPLLEAMACGCPIISSNIPTTREIAGDCPIYFDPLSLESICNALDIVYTEGRKLDRIQDGLNRSYGYSFEITARKTLQLYQSLI